MRFTPLAFLAALPFLLCEAVPFTNITGVKIPLTKRSKLVDANGVVSTKSLNRHLTKVQKYDPTYLYVFISLLRPRQTEN